MLRLGLQKGVDGDLFLQVIALTAWGGYFVLMDL